MTGRRERQESSGFAARLREVIDAYGSASGLAKTIGRSEGAVRKWLRGESEPNVTDLRSVCEQTGTSIEWLVGGNGRREALPPGVRDPPPPPYQNTPRERVNTQLLEGILLAVQEELRKAGLELPLLKQSMLVATLYDLSHERKEVDREAVARLVRLAGVICAALIAGKYRPLSIRVPGYGGGAVGRVGHRTLTGGGPASLLAFFPALLAVTLYSGAGPAVLLWSFANCAAAIAWGGSMVRPVLALSDRWALAAFALSTALSIAIGARARQAALEGRSALQRVEERAQHDVSRAEENKQMALSRLSHDLRTPLSTIIGWAQVLRAQNPPEQMRHGLEVIERNARTQTRIIQELLDARQAPAEGAARGNGPGPISP